MTDRTETPRYSFITESDEAGMGRIVVEDFRHGKPHPRYFGVPIEVARALSLAQSQLAEEKKSSEVMRHNIQQLVNARIAVIDRAAQAERERDELAEALTTLLNAVEGNHVTQGDCNQARAALRQLPEKEG